MLTDIRNCPICRKEFYPRGGWAYKDGGILYCSWKCLREKQKSNREFERKYHGKEVEQLTPDGELVRTFKNASEAYLSVEGVYASLTRACRERVTYKGYLWRYKDDVSEVQRQG